VWEIAGHQSRLRRGFIGAGWYLGSNRVMDSRKPIKDQYGRIRNGGWQGRIITNYPL